MFEEIVLVPCCAVASIVSNQGIPNLSIGYGPLNVVQTKAPHLFQIHVLSGIIPAVKFRL